MYSLRLYGARFLNVDFSYHISSAPEIHFSKFSEKVFENQNSKIMLCGCTEVLFDDKICKRGKNLSYKTVIICSEFEKSDDVSK